MRGISGIRRGKAPVRPRRRGICRVENLGEPRAVPKGEPEMRNARRQAWVWLRDVRGIPPGHRMHGERRRRMKVLEPPFNLKVNLQSREMKVAGRDFLCLKPYPICQCHCRRGFKRRRSTADTSTVILFYYFPFNMPTSFPS